jgi:NhaA family Na+:H+ antiporter
MATDIALALVILAVFGRRLPIGLKVFLTALAIADDIGAVLVIAVFYTEQVRLAALAVAGVLLLLLLAANRAHLRRPGVYILLAIGVWAAVFTSGVHATVAGILVAFVVPVRARIDPAEFMQRSRGVLGQLTELGEGALTRVSMLQEKRQRALLEDLYQASGDMRPPGITLESILHPVQAFFVLPLFALFNAGVAFNADMVSMPPDRITLGVVLGLVAGKQIGVMLFSWIAIRSGRASLPEGVGWPMIYGASVLAGVGFTMSLFISELAFAGTVATEEAKLGILAGSLLAVAVFVNTLRSPTRRRQSTIAEVSRVLYDYFGAAYGSTDLASITSECRAETLGFR